MSENALAGEISGVVAEAEKIAEDAGTTFGHLTPPQLNWKPSADEWSIGQCFDHLIVTNKKIFPIMEKIIKGEKKNTLWQSVPFLPGFFGRLFIKSLDPDSTRKLKAPKVFQPSSSQISGTVINDFMSNQSEVVNYLKATEGLNLKSIVVTSPVSPLIIYNALDAIKIIVIHERRHFIQARRVLEAEGFPS